jgi:hypothetical protein
MKQISIIILISFLIFNNSYAQDNCQVALETIKGTYTGPCLNGKANGSGRAIGTDTYEGEFVNGLPEGKGMYTWKDGHYYIGQFKKGKMEGAGEMFYESAKGDDSTITGFWKKDKYVGLYEKAYIIHASTTRINKLECRASKKVTAGSINITTGGVSFIPSISDIAVITGQYLNKTTSNLSNGVIVRLQQMIFPFRAIFYLNNGEYFEIQFNEEADYEVSLSVM